ncbi:MAG: hypothetical protein ACLTSZ_14575 [Lachnospiraceae bacterium]
MDGTDPHPELFDYNMIDEITHYEQFYRLHADGRAGTIGILDAQPEAAKGSSFEAGDEKRSSTKQNYQDET